MYSGLIGSTFHVLSRWVPVTLFYVDDMIGRSAEHDQLANGILLLVSVIR